MSYLSILSLFTLPEIIGGIYLICESSTSKKLDMKGVIFGVILMTVPMMGIVVSIIYLYATSISNAALLKDSIAILFLSDIDKQVLTAVVRFTPNWVECIEKSIATNAKGKNATIGVSKEKGARG